MNDKKNIFKDAMGTAKNVSGDTFLKNVENKLLTFQACINSSVEKLSGWSVEKWFVLTIG